MLPTCCLLHVYKVVIAVGCGGTDIYCSGMVVYCGRTDKYDLMSDK